MIYDDKQMGRSSVTQGNVTTQAAGEKFVAGHGYPRALEGIREEINLTRQWHPINHDWHHAESTSQPAYARAEGETIRDAATAGQPTRTSWHMDITYQGLPEGVDASKLKPYEYFPRRYSLKIAEWNADGSRVGQPLVGRYQNAPVTDAGAYAK